jgi:hypothetical protein
VLLSATDGKATTHTKREKDDAKAAPYLPLAARKKIYIKREEKKVPIQFLLCGRVKKKS